MSKRKAPAPDDPPAPVETVTPAKVRLTTPQGGEAHVAPDQVDLWVNAGLGWRVAD